MKSKFSCLNSFLLNKIKNKLTFCIFFCYSSNLVVFLVGRSTDLIVQANIEREDYQYRDMVQGNFFDHYSNLTFKTIMGYRWARLYCRKVKVILKMDDDVYLDVFKFFDYFLPMIPRRRRTIYGFLNRHPKVFREGKYKVGVDEFAKNVYPDFTSGFFIVPTPDIIDELYEVSKIIRFVHLEDVYTYGLVREAMTDVQLVHLDTITYEWKVYKDCVSDHNIPVVFDSVVLDSVVLDSVVLDSVVLDSVVLDSVVFDSVVLDSVVFDSVVLDSVILDSVVLDSVALDSVVLDSVVFDSVVLDSVVFDSVVLDSVVLDSVVLNSVALDSVVLDSVVLDSVALDSVALDSVVSDSVVFDSVVFDSVVLDSVVLDSVVLDSVALDSVALDSVVLDSVVLDSVVFDSVVLDSVVLDSVVLDSVALDSVALDSVVFDSVVLDSVAWDSVVLDSVALDSVAFDSVVLSSVVLLVYRCKFMAVESLPSDLLSCYDQVMAFRRQLGLPGGSVNETKPSH
ncbi:Beta-1,3-galactosyltransferase 1 [Bulinus truncatus]|nr:Beta-1,3-galactosyltransferase 1 [Bulinus truncatus]